MLPIAHKIKTLLAVYQSGLKYIVHVSSEGDSIRLFFADIEGAMRHCITSWAAGPAPEGVSLEEWYTLVGHRKKDGIKNIQKCYVAQVDKEIARILMEAAMMEGEGYLSTTAMGFNDVEADMLIDILLNCGVVKAVSPNKETPVTDLDDILKNRFGEPCEEYVIQLNLCPWLKL